MRPLRFVCLLTILLTATTPFFAQRQLPLFSDQSSQGSARPRIELQPVRRSPSSPQDDPNRAFSGNFPPAGILPTNSGSNSIFSLAPTYGSGGSGAFSVAAADVNGDGKLDLIVTNSCDDSNCDGTVGVLLGNGDGTFQAAVNYSSGFDTESVAVADVNGDGKPDLLVANECSSASCTNGSVDVLLGNGDGTFQAAVTYALESLPNSVAVADVNGDGKLDLVAVGDDSVDVLLGNGDGTFQSPSKNITESGGESVAIGDVNGDSKLDLVVANHGDGTPNSGSVSVFLGNGDGTFQAAVSYSTGAIYTDAVILGDMNGDGTLDLVVASQ